MEELGILKNAFNCTVNELKPQKWADVFQWKVTFNCTVNELKLFKDASKDSNKDLLIAQ
mgnify:CR=1 FL=1